jgi:ketosteroid isomerase-like protein
LGDPHQPLPDARRNAANPRSLTLRQMDASAFAATQLRAAIIAMTVFRQASGQDQVMTPSIPSQTDEQRVLSTEDEYIAAEVARDEATLRRMIDDRFAFNSSKGTLTGKEDFIQTVLKLTMVGQTIRERSVLVEGDIALIFGTAELRFADPGKEESAQNLRYTSTYVKRQGQWRMLALQMQQRAPK